MSYELVSSAFFGCTDRRARYRSSRRPAPAKRAAKVERVSVSSAPSEQQARKQGGGARWRRIEQLSQKLAEQLPEDVRATWIELEEALNAHWLDVASDHYRRGFAAGSAEERLMLRNSHRASTEARLRALIALLASLADELESASKG